MSKGIVFYADGDDYVLQSCLSAKSLKAFNDVSISIITNNHIDSKYKNIFDKIIETPWIEHDNSRFSILNRWKIYHFSPYEETIVLDSDTLVLQNIDFWWKLLDNYNLFFLDEVYTYRTVKVNDNVYRKAFRYNFLPNLYSGFHYFKKNDTSKEFFAWVELISKNWELFYGNFCKEYYPKHPSMDVTFSIASKILHNDKDITSKNLSFFINFVHMKPYIQGWQMPKDLWTDKIGVYFNNNKLYIGNYLQKGVFHYASDNNFRKYICEKYDKIIGE